VDSHCGEEPASRFMTQRQSISAVDPRDADIRSVRAQIPSHKVSPVTIVDACLDRIERLNPALNAFITVLPNQAREDSRLAQSEIAAESIRGPLLGIPIAIKDFYDTTGIRTTAAFEGFKDRVPKNDALGVAKLKKAGAIMVGKTNMHRLGMGTTGVESAFGPVRNPWNIGYIAVGSSSGSAVASGISNTVFANYYGLPAISIPSGLDRNGLPLGLQIVGKPWDEAGVLHLAYRCDKATGWASKRLSSRV
jgi:Asp-tRNA(Asn)/Glu-tRNA(Gln) amidotransferase A subunit family amidase